MIVLDENFLKDQRDLLRRKRIVGRQIGIHLGRSGMDDREIIALLHGLNRSTFFTLDLDYYERILVHDNYCLVHLDIRSAESADYVIGLLRHREFDATRKRMGTVIRVSASKISYWRKGHHDELFAMW